MYSPNLDERACRSGRWIRPGECTSSPDAARCGMPMGHPLSVGVDVVSVADVSAALDRFGERYVRRVFTAHEAAYCLAATGAAGAARFAARFAAKEAAVKALEPEGRWTDWRTIEVRRQTSGACALVLHGEAATLAARRGIRHIALSMSHDGDRAAAVVVALRASHTRHVEDPHV